MARPQLKREIPTQRNNSRLARAIAKRSLRPRSADAQARDARRDNNAARVLDGSALLEERRELLYAQEDALDVQVHDLLERGVGVRVEGLAPGGARVREQDVDVRGVLGDLGDEGLDAGEGAAVGGDGDGAGAGLEVGEGVELGDGGVAGFGFARGDEYFGAAGLEETGVGG